MSNATIPAVQMKLGVVEKVILFTVSTIPCFVFLYINVIMLYTLRCKPVFRETCRYILLFNLLFADTVLLIQSQFFYMMATANVILTQPVCCVIVLLANLTAAISPLILVLMCLERYVAVCYPLRHTTIVSVKNTGVAITVVWAFSSLSVLIRIVLLLNFLLKTASSLVMKNYCGIESVLLDPVADLYDKVSTYFFFVSAGATVVCTYIGVMVAARSASTDKASNRKARNTLLLHMVQLGFSVSSTLYNPIFLAVARTFPRIIVIRSQIVLYLLLITFPRCLCSLIYGIRDQTIRRVLMCHLCCRRSKAHPVSVVNAKDEN